MTPERLHWREQAACIGYPSGMFFPTDSDDLPVACERLCERCPVRKECLDHGLAHEPEGIWGGMTANQRRRMRKRLGIRVSTPNNWSLRAETTA